MPAFTTFDIVLKVLARAIRQEKIKNKKHPNWKRGSKVVICRWHDLICQKIPHTKKARAFFC